MDRARSGLRIVLWGWLLIAVVGVTGHALETWLLQRLHHVGLEGHSSLLGWMDLTAMLSSCGGLATAVALALGLGRWAGAPPQTGARGLARAALPLAVLLAVGHGVVIVLQVKLGNHGFSSRSGLWQAITWTHRIDGLLELAVVGLLAASLLRAARFLGLRRVAAVAVPFAILFVVHYGLYASWALGLQPLRGLTEGHSLWVGFALVRGPFLAFDALLLASLHVVSSRLPADEAAGAEAAAGAEPGEAWLSAGSSLETYRGALAANIWILVVGYGVMILAVPAKSVDLLKFSVYVTPVVSFCASLVMIAGLYGYTALPSRSGGRELAVVALVAVLLAAAVDARSYGLVLGAFEGGGAARDLAERIQHVAAAQQAVALAALLALVASFRRAARALGSRDLVERTGVVAGLVLVAIPVVVGIRLAIAGGETEPSTLLVLAALVLAYAILTVVLYLRLVGGLARAMVQPSPPEVP